MQIHIFRVTCALHSVLILHESLVFEEDDLLAAMTAVKRDPPKVVMTHKGVLGMKYN